MHPMNPPEHTRNFPAKVPANGEGRDVISAEFSLAQSLPRLHEAVSIKPVDPCDFIPHIKENYRLPI
jgi:hypothetical protein